MKKFYNLGARSSHDRSRVCWEFFSSVVYGLYIFILFYPSLQKFYTYLIVVS